MQMRNVHMMQMSHAGVQMQSLFMMMQMSSYGDTDAKYPYDTDVPCRGANEKFIHDDTNEHIKTMMQMSSCRYVMMQMPPCGYAMMQMF